jgi:Uma2 family endonuclease
VRINVALPATKRLTLEEFQEMNLDGRYELVDGQLAELVPPRPMHSWSVGRICGELDRYLELHEPDAFWGVALDIPTIPFFGRRPDFAFYSTADAARLDLTTNRVLGVPTLVVEVVSEEDEERDTVTKREEYARGDSALLDRGPPAAHGAHAGTARHRLRGRRRVLRY